MPPKRDKRQSSPDLNSTQKADLTIQAGSHDTSTFGEERLLHPEELRRHNRTLCRDVRMDGKNEFVVR